MNAYSVASFRGLLVSGCVAAAGCTPTTADTQTPLPGLDSRRAPSGNKSSYVLRSTKRGLLGALKSCRNTLLMNDELGPAPVATITGALVGTSSSAVVLNPSRVASPGASGPKVGMFCTRAFVAGASGSSGSVLPSSSRLEGSGTTPALASTTGCALGAVVARGAIWNVVRVAISVFGKSLERIGNGPAS